MSTNDITGDALRSKLPTDDYRKGYDLIFGKKEEPKQAELFDEVKELNDDHTNSGR